MIIIINIITIIIVKTTFDLNCVKRVLKKHHPCSKFINSIIIIIVCYFCADVTFPTDQI